MSVFFKFFLFTDVQNRFGAKYNKTIVEMCWFVAAVINNLMVFIQKNSVKNCYVVRGRNARKAFLERTYQQLYYGRWKSTHHQEKVIFTFSHLYILRITLKLLSAVIVTCNYKMYKSYKKAFLLFFRV